ncbi:hypothetical protein KQX54_004942 [Cotesia glomerata]|uniref:Uncharacterized protein n=1 Tax=Cotesia glomerata TaxID=32391 RepID=A0AAV7IJN1_COTGL|nr:hypothetical protein KQX54_004942 [Cotesia glomerata]
MDIAGSLAVVETWKLILPVWDSGTGNKALTSSELGCLLVLIRELTAAGDSSSGGGAVSTVLVGVKWKYTNYTGYGTRKGDDYAFSFSEG